MIQIRRSYLSYAYVAVFLFVLVATLDSFSNDLMLYLISLFWIFSLLVVLIRRIAYREYILMNNEWVKVYMDFKTERFPKNSVTQLFLQNDPFRSSYFLLQSGKKIRFDAFGVSGAELAKLQDALK